ncbi:MAG: AmmeMemoRadiSam system protein B [Candidatus Micrarchaeia archaeon]
MKVIRRSAFAGSFYPSSRQALTSFVEGAIERAHIAKEEVENAYAYQVPHAGYEYSGDTAAYAYKALSYNSSINKIDTILLVGPNHTGYGMPISVSMLDWETPLGVAMNDRELSEAIAQSKYISIDEEAHRGEHSLEVQLPFMQYLFNKEHEKKYAFICMGDQSLEASKHLYEAIENAVSKLKRRVVIIASSDLNHYESAASAGIKDAKLLDAIKEIDYEKVNRLISQLDISACGYGPITVAMMYSQQHGAKKGVVLDYTNSGRQTGDYSSVVEYSAIAFV